MKNLGWFVVGAVVLWIFLTGNSRRQTQLPPAPPASNTSAQDTSDSIFNSILGLVQGIFGAVKQSTSQQTQRN